MEKHLHQVPELTFDEKPRLAWQPPRLTLLGNVASMTESGSMVAMEDAIQNGFCIFRNMTGNMC
jgi:hypothetical protein